MSASDATWAPVPMGRYVLFQPIGKGAMATVHFGRLRGSGSFARTVAIKRLHPHLAQDPDFVAMLTDEAHLVSRIAHPNVVSVIDFATTNSEQLLVMDYVHGVSLGALMHELRGPTPPGIAVRLLVDVLHGLHAAHEARSDSGAHLNIVHRDVSPDNILVGADGVCRVVDFGIAKAALRSAATTQEGTLKGKIAYMAPEQLTQTPVDRRTDIYGASVVLWELLTGQRLFHRAQPTAELNAVLVEPVRRPSEVGGSPAALDAVVLRGLSRAPKNRFGSAEEMAAELEQAFPPASAREVAEWVADLAAPELERRTMMRAHMESQPLGPPSEPEAPATPLASRPLEATQGTSPSLSTGTAFDAHPSAPTTRRTATIALVVAGVVLLLAAGAWGASHFARSGEPRAPEVAPSADAEPPPAQDLSPPPQDEPPRELDASPPAPMPRPGGKSPRPRVNCNPPYTLDSNGVRMVKRECVK